MPDVRGDPRQSAGAAQRLLSCLNIGARQARDKVAGGVSRPAREDQRTVVVAGGRMTEQVRHPAAPRLRACRTHLLVQRGPAVEPRVRRKGVLKFRAEAKRGRVVIPPRVRCGGTRIVVRRV